MNSSNEMIPVVRIVGSQERIQARSPNNIIKRDPETRMKFKTYLETLFHDLCMRDNGGRDTKIDHYHFLKVIYSPNRIQYSRLPIYMSQRLFAFMVHLSRCLERGGTLNEVMIGSAGMNINRDPFQQINSR